MLWKFFLIDFTRVDTEKIKFEPKRPWRAAVLRLERKFHARHTFQLPNTSGHRCHRPW